MLFPLRHYFLFLPNLAWLHTSTPRTDSGLVQGQGVCEHTTSQNHCSSPSVIKPDHKVISLSPDMTKLPSVRPWSGDLNPASSRASRLTPRSNLGLLTAQIYREKTLYFYIVVYYSGLVADQPIYMVSTWTFLIQPSYFYRGSGPRPTSKSEYRICDVTLADHTIKT